MNTRWSILLLAAVLAGCASDGGNPSTGDARKLKLELSSRSRDSRYTYFELTRTGELRFAGGRNALTHTGSPVGAITPEERRRLWDIIDRHDLTHAPGKVLPPDFEKTRYELNLNGRTIYAADDQLPGVVELHDALFQMQADRQYRIQKVQ